MENNVLNEKRTLTFTLFADMHYKKGMYIATVADLECVLARASQSNSDFIIHAGDFCNDYVGSPELTNTYLKNKYNLPAYGIYGNHELESDCNTMNAVTPLLTNRPDEVVWGSKSGKLEDGTIGYYYFDIKGFRIICTDTNYSFNTGLKIWEHNMPESWGPPDNNCPYNGLGDRQLRWLENTLLDAAYKHINCIVMSHDSYSGIWESSPDCNKVRDMFKKVNQISEKTVIAAINGHYHCNASAVKDNIYYLNVNSVFNGVWQAGVREAHYKNGEIFNYTEYDKKGSMTKTYKRDVSELTMAKNTYFYRDPLSAVIEISNDGIINVCGSETKWRYDVVPEISLQDLRKSPIITSEIVKLY